MMKHFVNEEQRKKSGSTCYLEFQQGYYHDVCWLNTSISLSAELWDHYGMSKLLRDVIPNFDFYEITVVTRAQWEELVKKSQEEIYSCKEIIAEAAPWAFECFEEHPVFSIIGM